MLTNWQWKIFWLLLIGIDRITHNVTVNRIESYPVEDEYIDEFFYLHRSRVNRPIPGHTQVGFFARTTHIITFSKSLPY